MSPRCALAVAAVALGGCGDAAPPADAPRAGWTSYRDAVHDFRVEFPSDWRRATRSLTPSLSDPHEILSLGTGRLAVRSRGCAHQPVATLEAMRTTDALLTIQERRPPLAAGGYPQRRRPFRLGREDRPASASCLRNQHDLRLWWRSFRDRGRGFYVLVAIGRKAPARTRIDVERIIDSLRFGAA